MFPAERRVPKLVASGIQTTSRGASFGNKRHRNSLGVGQRDVCDREEEFWEGRSAAVPRPRRKRLGEIENRVEINGSSDVVAKYLRGNRLGGISIKVNLPPAW